MDFRINITDAGTSREQFWINVASQDGLEVPISEQDFKNVFLDPSKTFNNATEILIPLPAGTDITLRGNEVEIKNWYNKAQDILLELNQQKLLSKSNLKQILDSIEVKTYEKDITVSSFFFGLFKKKRHAKCMDIKVSLDKEKVLKNHPDFKLDEYFLDFSVYWKKSGKIPHTLEEAHEKEEYAICKEGEGLKCYLHNYFFKGESVEIGDKESFPSFTHERVEKNGKFIFSLKERCTPEYMENIDPDIRTAIVGLAFRPDFKALQKAFGIKEGEFNPQAMVQYQQENPGTLRGRMDMYPFYSEIKHFVH